jgi:hypothetical protein
VSDLVPVSHDAVDRFAEPSIRVSLKALSPFLAETASQIQYRPHLGVLELPQTAFYKVGDRRVGALPRVFRVRNSNGILQEPAHKDTQVS